VLGLPRGRYTNPRLSPDGRRVMVESGGTGLELLDFERGTHTRLTGEARTVLFGLWNADGSRVVYQRARSTVWLATDGTGQQGEVKYAFANDFPSGAGPDPDSFLVTRVDPQTAGDVVLLSMSGAFEPRSLVATAAYEGGAQLSPDRRWLVHVSTESGAPEVYVRRYPALDRKWQVSEGGGSQPRWSASGLEIYYRGGARLAAVAFDGKGSEPALGKPVPVFEDEYDLGQGITNANYDVTPGGRFLMLRRDADGGQPRLVLVCGRSLSSS
jgi:serine/threonine-protein kinase